MFKTFFDFLKDQEYRNLLITTILFIVSGTVVYHFVEKWSWLDSFYFSIVALTTTGFGDFSPSTNEGKIFTILYLIFGVGLILRFVDVVYSHYLTSSKKRMVEGPEG